MSFHYSVLFLNVFAISHDYARFYVPFFQILRINPFYEAFIGLVDPLLFSFTLFLNVLISFAASDVISELLSRIFNLLFILPGEMR